LEAATLQPKLAVIRSVEGYLAEQGFQKLTENHRIGNVTADEIFYNTRHHKALILFARSRLSSEFENRLKELRHTGLSVAIAVPQRPIEEKLLETCRSQNIGLLSAYSSKAEWVVSFPEEKATPAVLRFKQRILQGKLNLLAEKMKKWAGQGPICPQHKIPSEAVLFEGNIQMRGWKCKHGDFEIIHPLDAELSLFLNKFGPLKARAANVGGQVVLRLPKLVAVRYNIQEGKEYELDVTDVEKMNVRNHEREAPSPAVGSKSD
jgi:hypothetical protein